MDKTSATLNQFFSFKELSKERISEIAKSKEFSSLREKISKELKGLPVPDAFFEQMIKQVSELLNIDVGTILGSAWSKYEEFLEYRDQEKYPPEEIVLVPLAEHTIISEHAPCLRPQINKVSLGEIKFDISLELALKGVILKIQNGKIMEATLGSCEGKGSVKHGDFSILERQTEPFSVPGSLSLGEGLAIPGPREDESNNE